MGFPRLSACPTTLAFVNALEEHQRILDAAYRRLRGMYDASEPFSHPPDWVEIIDGKHTVRHVSIPGAPRDESVLEAALTVLSDHTEHQDCEIVRVAHGVCGRQWTCYILCVPKNDGVAEAT